MDAAAGIDLLQAGQGSAVQLPPGGAGSTVKGGIHAQPHGLGSHSRRCRGPGRELFQLLSPGASGRQQQGPRQAAAEAAQDLPAMPAAGRARWILRAAAHAALPGPGKGVDKGRDGDDAAIRECWGHRFKVVSP